MTGAATWPDEIASNRFQAVYACNVCHISPFAVTEGLLRGAARVLAPGGGLFIDGPPKGTGTPTAARDRRQPKRNRTQQTAPPMAGSHGPGPPRLQLFPTTTKDDGATTLVLLG